MHVHDLFKEGCIGAFYGLNDFVKIYPALDIDRIQFSFVHKKKKGDEKGGNGIDVYIDADRFYALMRAVLDGTFARAIANDTNQYPSLFPCVAGANGAKELKFGKSTKGWAVIQGFDKSVTPAKRIMVPIDQDTINAMALWYMRVIGEKPSYGHYISDMIDLFWKGVEDRKKFHKGPSEADLADEVPNYDAYLEEMAQNSANSHKKDAPKSAASAGPSVGNFRTASALRDAGNGDWDVKVTNNSTGKTAVMKFPAAAVSKWEPGKLDKLRTLTAQKAVRIDVSYTADSNGVLTFIEFAAVKKTA